MHPVRRARPAGAVVFVGADVDQRGGVAVIGGLQHDHVTLAGEGPRQAQRQFVGLAARVDEVTHAQRLWQKGGQLFGIAGDVIVQVARVGVEHAHLPLRRRHHARVVVSHVRHVVVRVQVLAALVVEQVLFPAAHDLERILIRDGQVTSQPLAAICQSFGLSPVRVAGIFQMGCPGLNSDRDIS